MNIILRYFKLKKNLIFFLFFSFLIILSMIISCSAEKYDANDIGVGADLKAPTSGSTVKRTDGKATFTWEGSDPDSGDTLAYTLYVDKTDGKQTPPSAQTDLSVLTLDVALDAATTYYWRVKSSDGTNSSYSTVYTFKTE